MQALIAWASKEVEKLNRKRKHYNLFSLPAWGSENTVEIFVPEKKKTAVSKTLTSNHSTETTRKKIKSKYCICEGSKTSIIQIDCKKFNKMDKDKAGYISSKKKHKNKRHERKSICSKCTNKNTLCSKQKKKKQKKDKSLSSNSFKNEKEKRKLIESLKLLMVKNIIHDENDERRMEGSEGKLVEGISESNVKMDYESVADINEESEVLGMKKDNRKSCNSQKKELNVQTCAGNPKKIEEANKLKVHRNKFRRFDNEFTILEKEEGKQNMTDASSTIRSRLVSKDNKGFSVDGSCHAVKIRTEVELLNHSLQTNSNVIQKGKETDNQGAHNLENTVLKPIENFNCEERLKRKKNYQESIKDNPSAMAPNRSKKHGKCHRFGKSPLSRLLSTDTECNNCCSAQKSCSKKFSSVNESKVDKSFSSSTERQDTYRSFFICPDIVIKKEIITL